jgi:hypothetical protein
VIAVPVILVAPTGLPGAEVEFDVPAKPAAICPRCERDSTINTATTALTELHYCLVCRQSFAVRRASVKQVAEPVSIGTQDRTWQARGAARPTPQQCRLSSSGTGSCHWVWEHPTVVIGGLVLASLLLYAWRSM